MQESNDVIRQVTYTIACSGDLLIACVPDGEDMNAAIAAEEGRANATFERDDVTIQFGLVLTDEPQDGDEVRYSGTKMGRLTDNDGRTYDYAVRRV